LLQARWVAALRGHQLDSKKYMITVEPNKGEKEKNTTAKIHMFVGAPPTEAFNGHGPWAPFSRAVFHDVSAPFPKMMLCGFRSWATTAYVSSSRPLVAMVILASSNGGHHRKGSLSELLFPRLKLLGVLWSRRPHSFTCYVGPRFGWGNKLKRTAGTGSSAMEGKIR
jgi:hypothetical protein